MSPDVAKLICGNVEELNTYLSFGADVALVERALVEARKMPEGKTKVLILERYLRRLDAAAAAARKAVTGKRT